MRPLAGTNGRRRIEDTLSDDNEAVTRSVLEGVLGRPEGWSDPETWFLRFIDDGLTGEQLHNSMAVSHFTQNKTVKIIHASKTERFFKTTKQNAEAIGMKINALKTQMIYMTASNSADINTFINVGDNCQLLGQNSLKMLGFTFGRKPTADLHIANLKSKFYGKTWIIRHLQRAGIPGHMLLEIYMTFIRPVLEYASVAYHCILTAELTLTLENLQPYALKLIL